MVTRRTLMLMALMGVIPAQIAAQQPPARADTTARADYKNLNELMAALPTVAAPALDEAGALWLGSLPLSCFDRLQARPGRAGGARAGGPGGAPAGRAGGAAPTDSAARSSSAPRDTTVRSSSAPRDTTSRSITAQRDTTGSARDGGAGRGTLSGSDYFWVTTYRLIPAYKTTRAFWGCTDWHSAVSSAWATARLLRDFPGFGLQELAREKLNDHLGKSNLDGELAFFRTAAGSFERPYGYGWLLKLQAELRVATDSQARRWAANVAPLANWMADSLAAHMSALARPVRTGSQANTALTLNLALDYADASANIRLRTTLQDAARKFYLADKECDTRAEAAAGRSPTFARAGGAATDSTGRGARAGRAGVPTDSGGRAGRAGATPDSAGRAQGAGTQGTTAAGTQDILSPCLMEAALMARVLAPAVFARWLDAFLPPLQSARFAPLTEAAGATATGNDRARLSALGLQRAYALERIGRGLPVTDARLPVLRRLAALHAARGFELLRQDTQGTHWLPAIALLYTTVRRTP